MFEVRSSQFEVTTGIHSPHVVVVAVPCSCRRCVLADVPALQSLIALQALDTAADAARKRLAELPAAEQDDRAPVGGGDGGCRGRQGAAPGKPAGAARAREGRRAASTRGSRGSTTTKRRSRPTTNTPRSSTKSPPRRPRRTRSKKSILVADGRRPTGLPARAQGRAAALADAKTRRATKARAALVTERARSSTASSRGSAERAHGEIRGHRRAAPGRSTSSCSSSAAASRWRR